MQDTLNQIAHDTFVRSEAAYSTASNAGTENIMQIHEHYARKLHRIAERIAALTGATLGQILDTQEANDPILAARHEDE